MEQRWNISLLGSRNMTEMMISRGAPYDVESHPVEGCESRSDEDCAGDHHSVHVEVSIYLWAALELNQ
jgi:hypothetical protein